MAATVAAELLVGLRRDPVYGISLTVGIGGVEAELLGDVATLILPADETEIRAALTGLRLAPLTGYRGRYWRHRRCGHRHPETVRSDRGIARD